MKNVALRDNLKNIVKNSDKIQAITKGTIGGFSIEIETKEPQAFDSYLYKTETLRNNDLFELNGHVIIKKLITNNNSLN